MKTRLIPRLFPVLVLVAGFAAPVIRAATDAPTATAGSSGSGRIHRTVPFHYPARMVRDGVKRGEARIILRIDAEGRLTDSLAVAYTHRIFADEALETIKQWRFDPAPAGAVIDLTVSFKVEGTNVVERTRLPLNEELTSPDEYSYRPHGFESLDRIPVPSQTTPPVYPKEWSDQGLAGRVTVDFYIDETGRTRMPTTAAGTNPMLGASAIAAVEGWRFEPPVFKGKPVLVHVQQAFNFSPDTPPR